MSIRSKLISILLLISMVPIVFLSVTGIQMASDSLRAEIGSKFENIAIEKSRAIEAILNSKIEEAVILATHPLIIKTLRKANESYRGRTDSDALDNILAMDRAWISKNGKTQIATSIAANELSAIFKHYQNRNTDKYGEIFVTDVKGANVAMTKALSDYYQADESWWKEAFSGGKGKVFFDDRGFDESVGAIVIGAVVPVMDDGEVLGILKINYKVTDVINVISNTANRFREGVVISIARNSGSLVISPGEGAPRGITEPELQILTETVGGWVPDIHDGMPTIMGYGPISVPIYSRILPKGSERGIKGEKWHKTTWFTILDIEQEVAFGVVRNMIQTYVLIGFVAILLVILVALLLAANISRPIRQLSEGAKIIAQGDLTYRVSLDRQDEIGTFARAFDKMTAELQETISSQRQLSRAIEQSHSMVQITDTDGVIEYINPSLMKFMGFKAEEMIGKTPRIFKSGETPLKTYVSLWETIKAGNEWKGEIKNKRRDGEEYWANLTISPLKDDTGQTTHFIATYEDLTERIAAEHTLRQIQKMDSLGSLSGGMAHDINNMLVPIINLTSSAIDTLPDDRKERKHLGSVIKAAEQVKALVGNILAFSRQEGGEMNEVNISELVQESVELIKSTMPSTIQLNVDLGGHGEKVNADRSQISSVLINLTSNSLDAMEGDTGVLGITLSVTSIDALKAQKIANLKVGDYANISISDTGTGIEDSILQQVFDPFFTTKNVGKGTGMGLSMAYGIMTSHGGAIKISKNSDKGTTVTLYLPLMGQDNPLSSG